MKSISLHVLMTVSVLHLVSLSTKISECYRNTVCIYECVCAYAYVFISNYFLHDQTKPLRLSQRAFHIIPENIYFHVKKIITLLKN